MTNLNDQKYFEWLVAQIEIPEVNTHTYNELFVRMHETEFVWTVPGDDNRVQDARDLRPQFLEDMHAGKALRKKFGSFVSVLEVLIALSRKVAFTAGGYPEFWAWQLIENLRLDKAYDPLTEGTMNKVDSILETLIWRTYQRDGKGGFFPLSPDWVGEDQNKVEIWHQMNAYVNEIEE